MDDGEILRPQAGRRRIVLFSEMVRHTQTILEQLEHQGFELIDRLDLVGSTDELQLMAALKGAWGTVAGGERYTRAVLSAAPALRVIVRPGVGYDAIDVSCATERGVAVLITPGANTESVADFALALILTCVRGTLAADSAVRSGVWRRPDLTRDLFGATVGIIGFGQIGQAVARRLRGFDCRLLVAEPFPNLDACRQLGVELLTLPELLPQVDVVTLHVPLMPATHHLIGERELRLMRRHSVIVNTSRGPVVDESALVSALRGGIVKGAGLDVFESEPLPIDHALAKLPNVVLAGHVASFTDQAATNMMTAVVAGLIAIAEGRMPAGCVNAAALAGGNLATQP